MKFALLIIGNIRLNDPKTPPNLGGVFGRYEQTVKRRLNLLCLQQANIGEEK